jgi:hypothetical protein
VKYSPDVRASSLSYGFAYVIESGLTGYTTYNSAYIIYEEEIESTSARLLLMKFFTFIVHLCSRKEVFPT